MADENNNGIPDYRERQLERAQSGGIGNAARRQDLKQWLKGSASLNAAQANRIVHGNANDKLLNKLNRRLGTLGGDVTDGAPDGGTDGGGGTGEPGSIFDQGAFDAMNQLLEQYGLSELSGFLQDLILDGVTDAASIQLALQQTDAWKRRFAGNAQLAAQGLGVLSPAEYLALERSYAQVMRNYGLPTGFYDDPSDFAGFIGNNVSAAELQTRVQSYADLANREDPQIVNQLSSMGLTRGDLLAYMIDPTRAMPIIQRTYQTTLLGAAARRSGFVADNDYLAQLGEQGVTEQQAQQGYGLIAENLGAAQNLADIYGEDYDADDMQAEVFQNSGEAARKRKRLASQERAAFSGSAGVGNLTRNEAGSY